MENLLRERRRCCCCRSSTRLWVSVIIAGHVLAAVTLSVALVTRLLLYKDVISNDMPGDMRFLQRAESSIFCSRHIAEATLDGDSKTARPEFSNTIPRFDVYLFDEDPSVGFPRSRRSDNLIGVTALQEGQTEYNAFYFLNGSTVSVRLCNEVGTCEPAVEPPGGTAYGKANTSDNIGVWAVVARGQNNFRSVLSNIDGGREPCESAPTGDDLCIQGVYVNTSGCQENVSFSQLNVNVLETDDYYFVFYNPASSLCQKYRYSYNVSRSIYSLKGVTRMAEDVPTYSTVRPDQNFLLDLRYYRSATENSLFTMDVAYKCDPAVIVYVGIFFLIPFAIIIITCLVLCCCCYDDNGWRYSSLSSYSDDDENATYRSQDSNQRAVSYGATQVR